jgi:hypothetical protein
MATNRTSRSFALAAAAGAVGLLLAGCGSGSSSDETSPSPAATAETSPAPSGSPIGGNVLPPVIIPDDATSATAKVGDTLVFNVEDPANTKISTTDTSILELTQGYSDGSAVFNPGAKALAAGTAIVTVVEPDEATYEVSITIE